MKIIWILCHCLFCLGVYSVGKTLDEAKKNFRQVLELHLSIFKEKAIEPGLQ